MPSLSGTLDCNEEPSPFPLTPVTASCCPGHEMVVTANGCSTRARADFDQRPKFYGGFSVQKRTDAKPAPDI